MVLGKLSYFTNLGFPEIEDFSTKPPFGGNRSCEVAIIWPDGFDRDFTTPKGSNNVKGMLKFYQSGKLTYMSLAGISQNFQEIHLQMVDFFHCNIRLPECKGLELWTFLGWNLGCWHDLKSLAFPLSKGKKREPFKDFHPLLGCPWYLLNGLLFHPRIISACTS